MGLIIRYITTREKLEFKLICIIARMSCLRDVPEVEEVVYLGGSGQHAGGDGVVDLDGGLGHDVSQGFDVLVEVLQLLVDHCAKDALDLTLLYRENSKLSSNTVYIIMHNYGAELKYMEPHGTNITITSFHCNRMGAYQSMLNAIKETVPCLLYHNFTSIKATPLQKFTMKLHATAVVFLLFGTAFVSLPLSSATKCTAKQLQPEILSIVATRMTIKYILKTYGTEGKCILKWNLMLDDDFWQAAVEVKNCTESKAVS